MKILLASPLYPPDIAEPAPYVKELARRLDATDHVTVLAYTRTPESVPGVRVIAVGKRYPLPIRILVYSLRLFGAALGADVLYAENGTSVELPAALIALITRIRFIFHIGDDAAHQWAESSRARRIIEHFASSQAKEVLRSKPLPRPEILPFVPYPTEAFAAYERSWDEHVALLEKIFHGKK